MTTEQIIRRFLGGTSGSNGRISTDGANLYSYSTLIAFKDGERLYVTTERYSVTTDRQIRALLYETGCTLGQPDIEREVSIQDNRTGEWTPPRSGRKGSVGNRPLDDMPARMKAGFSQVWA